jgi:uncharacterized protein (DUF983 family)
VYAGHAGVALALKGGERRASIVALTLACFGPDWVSAVLLVAGQAERARLLSHSLPAVLIGAGAASWLYSWSGRRGAKSIFIGWLLHWPADLLTGKKPLIFASPLVGVGLYDSPAVDFVVESLVVAVGCVLYARIHPRRGDVRRVIVILGVSLIALQGAVDVALAVTRNDSGWTALAPAGSRSHLPGDGGAVPTGLRMHLARRGSHSSREDAMATDGPRGIVTLVCLTCGKEKFFTSEVPAAVSCDQCGSTVFRTFATPTEPDEAAIDALEAQARSMAYGDSSPDTTQDDVRDLDIR